jgi:hypothetical protein
MITLFQCDKLITKVKVLTKAKTIETLDEQLEKREEGIEDVNSN